MFAHTPPPLPQVNENEESTPVQPILQRLNTVRDFVRFAVSRFNEAELFFGHGSDNAHDEAVYLILHTLFLPLDSLEPYYDAVLLDDEKERLLELIERRINERIPVAYLTNQAFQGEFEFYIDERVIVPRSFIHELLGEPLRPWIEFDELVHNALDLCTGSGTLAIQMAHHYSDAVIDAVDISPDALDVASINVENYGLEERIHLIESNLFDDLDGTYDLIVSNPPYVDETSMADLPDEYLHEPELALGSGKDGLDITRAILNQAADFLNPQGVLVVEIGHNRDALERAFPNLPFTWLETSGGDGFVFLLTKEQLLV